jgi:hypothetical protein
MTDSAFERDVMAQTPSGRPRCPKGLVDNKVCALDQTRSALRLVWRRENRVGVGSGSSAPFGTRGLKVNGNPVTIPRHREINELTAKAILKDAQGDK